MNKSIYITTFFCLKNISKILIPSVVLFLLIWQSVEYAHTSRQIKKLSQKKEALAKKNFELKASIATIASAEKMEIFYKQQNSLNLSVYNKKTVTILLPPEKKTFSFYE